MISHKSPDDLIEGKLSYTLKTYVREFIEQRGYSRAIIPLAHKIKPYASDIVKQFGEGYQPMDHKMVNTLTNPILFYSAEQLNIYKSIVEKNISTYFMTEGMQEFRFWSCMKKALSNSAETENYGTLQIILKDKAFDNYDYKPEKPHL